MDGSSIGCWAIVLVIALDRESKLPSGRFVPNRASSRRKRRYGSRADMRSAAISRYPLKIISGLTTIGASNPTSGLFSNYYEIVRRQVVQVSISEINDIVRVGDNDRIVAELEAVILNKAQKRRGRHTGICVAE